MLKTSSVKAMRSRPSESTDRLIVLTEKSPFSFTIMLESNRRVSSPHKLNENVLNNSPLTWFRLQAEADFFSSVSLNDFNIVCTLGMGGFSRVELVSGPYVQLQHVDDALQSPISSCCCCFLRSGAAEERDQSIVRSQSVEEAPHCGHQPARTHPFGAPDHDGGPQPVHRQVRQSLKGIEWI